MTERRRFCELAMRVLPNGSFAPMNEETERRYRAWREGVDEGVLE